MTFERDMVLIFGQGADAHKGTITDITDFSVYFDIQVGRSKWWAKRDLEALINCGAVSVEEKSATPWNSPVVPVQFSGQSFAELPADAETTSYRICEEREGGRWMWVPDAQPKTRPGTISEVGRLEMTFEGSWNRTDVMVAPVRPDHIWKEVPIQ